MYFLPEASKSAAHILNPYDIYFKDYFNIIF
jgi:hypothetical protein